MLDGPDGALAAVAGGERYGDAWLLRSLAVDPAVQRRGHRRALPETVLTDASRAGAREVLLTTDARRFFAAHGFTEVPREAAPAALRASAEPRGACPDNATLMRREVAP